MIAVLLPFIAMFILPDLMPARRSIFVDFSLVALSLLAIYAVYIDDLEIMVMPHKQIAHNALEEIINELTSNYITHSDTKSYTFKSFKFQETVEDFAESLDLLLKKMYPPYLLLMESTGIDVDSIKDVFSKIIAGMHININYKDEIIKKLHKMKEILRKDALHRSDLDKLIHIIIDLGSVLQEKQLPKIIEVKRIKSISKSLNSDSSLKNKRLNVLISVILPTIITPLLQIIFTRLLQTPIRISIEVLVEYFVMSTLIAIILSYFIIRNYHHHLLFFLRSNYSRKILLRQKYLTLTTRIAYSISA
ncbi:MAG: hypothetical protein ACTSXX_14570 [Candidatus Baldrarchaeia archaeon]